MCEASKDSNAQESISMTIYTYQTSDSFFDSLKDFTYEISENDIINNTCVGNNIGINNPMYGVSHTEETKALMSSQRVGKIPSESTILAASLANTGKKRPTVTCPHCDKSGGVGSMHQHHFDKCKFKTS